MKNFLNADRWLDEQGEWAERRVTSSVADGTWPQSNREAVSLVRDAAWIIRQLQAEIEGLRRVHGPSTAEEQRCPEYGVRGTRCILPARHYEDCVFGADS